MTYTLGVAMIARNGEKFLKRSLSPFAGNVDEIAVVYGGTSSDKTEKVVKRYATKIAHYDGPLGDNGELLDFAAARQQSFDLCNTDWVITVDADDAWFDVQEIRNVIDRMPEPDNGCVVWVPYSLGDGAFHQPRIFKRITGYWDGKIHERFLIRDEFYAESMSIKTGAVRIKQQNRSDEMNQERLQQNIDIGISEVESNPQNYRATSQLCNDYIMTGRFEEALSVTNHYLETWAADPDKQYDDELAHVWARRGIAQINTGDYANATMSELQALATFERGSCWTYLAESFLKMGMAISENIPLDADPRARSSALFDLTVFATDKALETGRTRSGYLDDVTLTTYKPLAIKAMALLGKQQPHKALRVLDLGLSIDPQNEMMLDLQTKVANSIGEVL